MTTTSWTLSPDPREIGRIRREVSSAVAEQGALAPERLGDLELAVSEVVTAALLQAGRERIHVDLRVEGEVEIVVRDARLQAGAGYGLSIVSAIADSLEVRSSPAGGTEVRIVFSG